MDEIDYFNNIDDLAALTKSCDLVVSIEIITFSIIGENWLKATMQLASIIACRKR